MKQTNMVTESSSVDVEKALSKIRNMTKEEFKEELIKAGYTPKELHEQSLLKSKSECKAFVESLYEDGKTPSERFGITHEQLSALDDNLFAEDSGD